MKRMINMTNTYMDTDRFRDGRDAMDFAGEFGCDGLELMYCKGGREDFFPADGIVGVHLRYFNEWVDLWKGNMDALVAEYDSIEQAKEVFGGLDRSCIIRAFREDLERARRCRASYMGRSTLPGSRQRLTLYRQAAKYTTCINRRCRTRG